MRIAKKIELIRLSVIFLYARVTTDIYATHAHLLGYAGLHSMVYVVHVGAAPLTPAMQVILRLLAPH